MIGKKWFAISMSALLLACGTFLTGCDELKATFDRRGYLESQARPLVSKMLSRDNIKYSCLKVKITSAIDRKNYNAAATLDDGEELDITIEDRGTTIWIRPDGKSHNTLKFYARELVTQILHRNLGESAARCTGVEITEERGGDTYRGKAELDNGSKCSISIENRSDGQIYVRVLSL